MAIKVEQYQSPYQFERDNTKPIGINIMHSGSTNGKLNSLEGTIAWFTQRRDTSQASAHYVIPREPHNGNDVLQFVDESKAAYAAGTSQATFNGATVSNRTVNQATISIMLEGDGNLEGYTPYQYQVLSELSKELQTKYSIPKENIVGHDSISQGRIVGPGKMFDWGKVQKDMETPTIANSSPVSTVDSKSAAVSQDVPAPGTTVDNDASPTTVQDLFKKDGTAFEERTNNAYMEVFDVAPEELLTLRPPFPQYEEMPMFLDMFDSSFKRRGVLLSNTYLVSTLKLCPTPENFSISSSKKINRYHTLTRWVEEHWGDEIDNISLSGSTFSFFGYGDGGVGLTYSQRDSTIAYQWLKELMKFYQVNGCIYQGDSDYEATGLMSVNELLSSDPRMIRKHPRRGMIKERLYLRLVYDYLMLYGRFESFDVVEDSKSPFRFTYTASFKAEKTVYLLDMPPDGDAINTEPSRQLKANDIYYQGDFGPRLSDTENA